MTGNVSVDILEKQIFGHIVHNGIYTVDLHWKMFKTDIGCWISK